MLASSAPEAPEAIRATLLKVHVLGHLDLFGVDLQNLLPALQVGQLHRHPPVKASGPGQGGVQRLGPVGGCQNDDAVVALKAVHLGEQLVQGLLPLVVAADLPIPLFADGVNLVDEYDTGGLFLGLLEKVPDLGGAHAHEHLHKFRAGHGEEGHVGFTGHRLGQHGLAGARRAHQQNALGHGGADFPDTCWGRGGSPRSPVRFSLASSSPATSENLMPSEDFTYTLALDLPKHHGVGAAGPLHQLLGHELPQRRQRSQWAAPS